MDRDNKPRRRERNVTGGGKGLFRRGQGLGSGPVGSSDGYAGRNESSFTGTDNGGRASFTPPMRTTSRGSSFSLMRVVIIIAAVMLLGGGGGGLAGLFGGASSGSGGGGVSPQGSGTVQGPSGTGQASGSDQGAGRADTSVAEGAREKRTQILGGGADQVTVLVYLCGTDLESRSGMATNDVREMMSAEFSDNVNLVLYTGGCASWRNNAFSSRVNQIWQIKDGELNCLEDNCGSGAMTDPNTLSSFLQYGAEHFPANRNMLIFWDHGGGSVSGYGYDEKNKSAGGMTLAGIKKALEAGGMTFDIVGFDTCLMATVENALMLDEFADYMLASEETEPGIGWYYTNWLTQLSRNTSMSSPELGKLIIDEYTRACNTSCRGQKTTLSIIDLAELSATVPQELSAFSRSISGMIRDKEYKQVSDARYQTREFAQSSRIDQVDLVDLALKMGTPEGQSLAKALQSAVKYNRTSSNMSNAYGVSIYFPYQRTSLVDNAVSTYGQIGMDEDYASCIREFAALETSGQAVSGGSTTAMPSLLGTLMESGGASGLDGSQMIGSLLNSFLGGDFGMISGLSGANTGFLSARSLPDDELVDYLTENQFDTSQLLWQSNAAGEEVLPVSDAQWDLVHDLELNMFYDDGEGYLDLGLDNVYDLDADGHVLKPAQKTWVSIEGQPVAYYHLDTTENGDDYTITGRVPAFLNDERVDLILVFDSERPYGYIAGARTVYEDETETVAKSLTELSDGDKLDFICDYYGYDGSYLDTYYIGDPLIVSGEPEISDTVVGDGNARICYRFTDIYNKAYWSDSILLD